MSGARSDSSGLGEITVEVTGMSNYMFLTASTEVAISIQVTIALDLNLAIIKKICINCYLLICYLLSVANIDAAVCIFIMPCVT